MLRPLIGPRPNAGHQADLHLLADPHRRSGVSHVPGDREIWTDLKWSALEYVLGLALAIAIGIPLGLAAGWYRRFSYAVDPFIAGLNATPQIAFLPLIIVWVGTGLAAKVLIIVLLAVLPIAIAAQASVRTTDARLIVMAKSCNAGEWQLLRSIILPSSTPYLLAGLRLAVGGMIGIVVGEFTARRWASAP